MFYPVAIIGAGPAGITAAIQLKRYNIKLLLLERAETGGLALNANYIENYPGFHRGISGKELIKHFARHLTKLGINVTKRNVRKVERANNGFRIITDPPDGASRAGKEVFWSRALIAASGTKPRFANIKGEKELLQRKRLFYEIKDLPRYNKNTVFTIIGGGDAAFDYALNLASKARLINIIFRSKKPKGLTLLVNTAKVKNNIHLFANALTVSMIKSKTSVMLKVRIGNKLTNIRSDYILIAAGREPSIDYLPKWFIGQTDLPYSLKKTGKKPGLFLAGDVRCGDYRQVAIAAGDGLLAAIRTIRYLTKK